MVNIKILKDFWTTYTTVLSNLYNKTYENLQIEKIEDLIYETKDIFIKNTQQKTGKRVYKFRISRG